MRFSIRTFRGSPPLRIALLVGVTGAMAAASTAQDTEALKTGVVKVMATAADGSQKIGTGFVVRRDGDAASVVTVSHVVEGAPKIDVEFFTRRNEWTPARVVGMEGADPRGLAALRVDGRIPPGVIALRMAGSGTLSGGEGIFTIGFSLVPWGVISGAVIGYAGRMITFSTSGDSGDSGGPLIKDGLVIGVVTEVKGQVGYAAPAVIARSTVQGWGLTVDDGPGVWSPQPVPPTVKTRLRTGEVCTGNAQCASGHCYPGPGLGERQYCLAADMNCAWPGEAGYKFGTKKRHPDDGRWVVCMRPGSGSRARFAYP